MVTPSKLTAGKAVANMLLGKVAQVRSQEDVCAMQPAHRRVTNGSGAEAAAL
jgi:hypothetical protein